MAIITSLKRAALDDAWDATSDDQTASLRDTLRKFETDARRVINGGSLASVGANGRSSAFSLYGPGQITPVEVVEMWRELIDRFDQSKLWLTSCATYGLDPTTTELSGFPVPAPSPVQNPTPIDEQAIKDWMMSHLFAITEIRSDYSRLRTGGGMQWA